jgi:hypothetical protein
MMDKFRVLECVGGGEPIVTIACAKADWEAMVKAAGERDELQGQVDRLQIDRTLASDLTVEIAKQLAAYKAELADMKKNCDYAVSCFHLSEKNLQTSQMEYAHARHDYLVCQEQLSDKDARIAVLTEALREVFHAADNAGYCYDGVREAIDSILGTIRQALSGKESGQREH